MWGGGVCAGGTGWVGGEECSEVLEEGGGESVQEEKGWLRVNAW